MAEKDYTSTIMRMAGNIAAGLAATERFTEHAVIEQSVRLANGIVKRVLEDVTLRESRLPAKGSGS